MLTAIGRPALGIALSAALLAALVPRADATSPAAPPGCAAAITATAPPNTTDVPIPDDGAPGAAVTSTIAVTGVTDVLDVDVTTKIDHDYSADLDITLTSPSGTVVTLTTDNGINFDDVFGNTTWDDDANPGGTAPYTTNNGLVTDHNYTANGAISTLAPEEPLAAFVDEPAAGTWTLTIDDDEGAIVGTLDEWSLSIRGSNTNRLRSPSQAHSFSSSTSVPIDNGAPNVVTSQINVSGAGSYLALASVEPVLLHTAGEELDVTLTHGGTTVTLTTDNGAALDNIFNQVFWFDYADLGSPIPYAGNPGLTTDHTYVNFGGGTFLTPEEAMGAFIGENPNGIWTLTVSDDTNGQGGSLEGWELNLGTTTCLDVSTNLQVDRDPATVGGDMTYMLDVVNRSPTSSLSNASVSLPLPSGIVIKDFASVDTPAGWSCLHPSPGNGGTVSCTKGTMAAGETADITVDVTPTASAAGVVTATATSTVAPVDAIPSNDSSSVTSTVVAPKSPANPPAIPNCAGPIVTSASNTSDVAISDGLASTVTSTINVTGAQPYLLDVDAFTKIPHTRSHDLDMTLTSPAGTVVTLATDNGRDLGNIFNGTTWDDDADPGSPAPYTANDGIVTDRVNFTHNQAVPRLVPVEAMGAFVGENPNGTWTLTVHDDSNNQGGTIDEWSLALSGLPAAPTQSAGSVTNPADVAITDTPDVDTTAVTVSGAGTYLLDADAVTDIVHPSPADLDVTVRSPQGTEVTLTTDNGTSFADNFAGTTWDDDADPGGQVPYAFNQNLPADRAYLAGGAIPTLVPEEAMAAFIGENPNGTWTLRVSDDQDAAGGTIRSFGLNFKTTPACPPKAQPGVNPPATNPPANNPPTPARLAASSFTLNPATFRAKPRGASIGAVRRPPFGTRIGYRLTVAASARFTVEKVLAGRRVGRRCVAQTRTNRTRPKCTRYVAVRGSFTHSGKAGANSLRFSGRLSGRKLAPGRYRLTLRATASGGRRAGPLRKLFTIAR